MSYNAWFQCINGCPGQYSLLEIIYRCPSCGDLLEVRHDMEALAHAGGGGLDQALRRASRPKRLSLRLRRVGEKRVGDPVHRQREHRLDLRGQYQSVLGQSLRQADASRRPLGQAVRQLAHRVVQRSRHDGAGVGGQSDDRQRRADRRGGLRVHRRYFGGSGRLRRRRRHSDGGVPAAR